MKKMEEKISLYEILTKYINEIKVAVYSSFVFLNINTDIVEVLFLLMICDTFFGIWKSYILKRNIKFSILFEGAISKLMILLIPMVLALMGKGLGYNFKPIPDTALKILIVAEVFSIFTSMYVIRTRKEPEDVDIITMLLNSIRKALMNIINFWLKKVENTTEVEIEINKKE